MNRRFTCLSVTERGVEEKGTRGSEGEVGGGREGSGGGVAGRVAGGCRGGCDLGVGGRGPGGTPSQTYSRT